MTIRKVSDAASIEARAPAAAPAAGDASLPRDSVEIGGRPASPQSLDALLAKTAGEAASLEKKLASEPHEKGEVLVKLKGGPSLHAMDDFVKAYGAKLLYKFDFPRSIYRHFDGELLHLKLPEGMTVAQAMAAMAKDPRVDYVVPNHVYKLEGTADPVFPNDLKPELWGLHNTGQDGGTPGADIKAPEAWAITTGRRDGGPVIAVIDTGADYNHPDLAANIWTNPGEVADGADNDGNGVVDDIHGYNALEDTGDPLDGHSHGTHVSGTIAAEGNNDQGVVGVNWQARVMPVKIFSDGGSTNAAAIVRGILYATRMGARITSNSWGGGAYNQAIRDAFAESPALHIMAAGNSSSDNDATPHYPSSYELDNIIAVAATTRNDELASFSSYGATSVDVGAPGHQILSTVPNGGYDTFSGTSMATPHVSGVAALIASAYPEATNQEIKERIIYSADKIPALEGKVLSGGRLNAARALENDTIAPGAPNDFLATEANSRGVVLRWTATGDDRWTGKASAYELRVSDRPITDEEGFQQAARVATGSPGKTGTWERVEIPLVPSGEERRLYFALKVVDNVGNRSEMRTTTALVPAADLAFEDTIDQGGDNWTAGEGWTRIEEEGRGFVWTDSPGGDYGNNLDTSLTSRPISLEGFRNSTLIFDARFNLENNFDKVFVEASNDGQNWRELTHFTGSSDWSSRTVDLSAYDGSQVQIRFRLKTDNSVTADGFYLDNVVIAGDRDA